MKLVSFGLPNKEIGGKLAIAVSTVNQYLRNLFLKLGVQNRTQLAVLVARGELMKDAG